MARERDFAELRGSFVTFYAADGSGPFRAKVEGAGAGGITLRTGPDVVHVNYPNMSIRRKKYGGTVAIVVRVKPALDPA